MLFDLQAPASGADEAAEAPVLPTSDPVPFIWKGSRPAGRRIFP